MLEQSDLADLLVEEFLDPVDVLLQLVYNTHQHVFLRFEHLFVLLLVALLVFRSQIGQLRLIALLVLS